MIFTTRRFTCTACGALVKHLGWDHEAPPTCACGGTVEPYTAPTRTAAVIDDQLEGGPRRFDTMGDDEPFIETKSQWRAEIAVRGLLHVDRHDRAYYDRSRKQHMERLRDTGQLR